MKSKTLEMKAGIAPEIQAVPWRKVLISVSGGKDSAALIAWAVQNFPLELLVAVHAVIDIDWKETLPVVRRQCAQFGIPLVEVQAVNKDGVIIGFLDKLTSPRVSKATGEVGEYKFPSMGQRWCTSTLKSGPIDKFARTFRGDVLVLIGERREESPKRAKLEAVRPDESNSCAFRKVVKYSPILELTEADVWVVVDEFGIEKHPCYGWGVSRASCAICIFSSNHEIRIAAERAPEIVAKYIEAEKKIEHTFRYQPATKKRGAIKTTVEQIVKGERV